ncbi:MAG: hydroxyacid dehydrogenase [Bacteroidetes bacterium]|nr:hydroxyacid dehydrogenase [Bacteroidota bacterium]
MLRPKIALIDENHSILISTLNKAGFECVQCWDKSLQDVFEILKTAIALVIRSRFKLDADFFNKYPNIKCIGRVGAGMENIDINTAKHLGVSCVNAPEGNSTAVGEHAMAMLLTLLNKIKIADAEVRQGIWKRTENRGTEIEGKTIGIIGYGHMGKSFAKRLSGFNCTILAYDKYNSDFTDNYAKSVSLNEIFNQCDIVSLHIPLTHETTYFASKQFFTAFKKEIYFINTARGKCVNTNDLVTALKSKKVIGACLDVLEYESNSFNEVDTAKPEAFNYLANSNNVILTPHIAGWSIESNYKMSLLVAERMIAALNN